MINETVSIDAGPAIGELDALASAAEGAAAKIDAAFKSIKTPSLGGSGAGNMARSLEAAAGKVEAAVAKIEASFARLGGIGAGAADSLAAVGRVASASAAGVTRLADAEKAAADAGARVSKSSTTAADGIKGLGDSTKKSSAWLDEYNATMAESAKMQRDFAKVSADTSAKVAVSQRLQTVAARDASADAVRAQKAQRAAAEESAAAAEASSKKHSTAILVGAAAVGYGIYKAAQLQTQVTRLYTSAGEQQKNLPLMTAGILRLSGQTATSQSELAQGAYMIESAGFHGKAALPVLRAAAQGAQAEGAPLGEVGNALTSLMISYGMKPGQATAAMNQIITMVGSGKMTMQGAVGALPNLLPVASKAGLSFGQAGGALATMTQTGMSPDQAAQNLAHTIGALQNPSHVQTLELQQLGVNSVKLSKNLGKEGLTGAISQVEGAILHNMGPAGTVLLHSFNSSKLAAASAAQEIAAMPAPLQRTARAYLEGSTSSKAWRTELQGLPAVQANVLKQFAATADAAHGFNSQLRAGGGNAQTFDAALSKAMGGTVGMRTALMLGGSHMGTFRANADAIAASAQHAGQNVKGWDDIQKNFNFRLGQFKYSAEAAATTVGNSLLPAATGVMRVLAGTGSFLADHPLVTKELAGVGGVLGASYAIQRVAKPVTTAVQGVGKVAQVLHIPGLDKLANVGGGGLAGAAGSLDGAGASLKGAAGSLESAAVSLRGAGATGEAGALGGAAGKGEAAAAAEGAGAGRLAGVKSAGMTAGLGVLATATIVDPWLKSMKNSHGNWLDNAFGTPKKSAWNNWGQLGHDITSMWGVSGGPAPARPAAIPAGVTPAFAARFGGGAAAPQPVVKPKVEPPDTGAISSALRNIGNIALKPVKMPGPDMSALSAARGKAQSAANGITQAMDSALRKVVKASPPDISAYRSAAGPARADGANISAGLAAGILAGEGAVVAAASQVASAAAAAMAHAVQSHSPSKKTEKTGKDMTAGLVIGLQGGQAAVDAAAAALGKNAAKATDIAAIDNAAKKLLGEVPRGDTALTRMLKADNRDLDRMANTRAKLEQEISDSEQVAKSAISGASIMNSLNAVNPAGAEPIASAAVVQGQQYQASSMKQFAQQLTKLQAMGLNATSLSQIAQAGPDQGLGIAQGITSGGKQAITQLNQLQKQMQSSAAQIGNVAGPAMYQAGKDAGAGLAAGLKSELGSLDKAMEHLAKAMAASVGKHAAAAKKAASKAGASVASGASAAAAASGGGTSGAGSLGGAAGSLSHAGAALSASAAALTAAASALRKDASGGTLGAGHVKHPVTAGGYHGGGYGGGMGTTAHLPFSGGGGGVHYHTHVMVQGNVTSERDLLSALQEHQQVRANNNWSGGWQHPGRAN